MKPTSTVYEQIPMPADPPIKEAIHTALRKVRPDLYQDGNVPELMLRAVGHVSTVLKFHESNDSLSYNENTTEAGLRPALLLGRVRVGDKDIIREPVSKTVSEDAVKRPRKLGRWD